MRNGGIVATTLLAMVVLVLSALLMMQHGRILDLESRLDEIEETGVLRAAVVVTALDDTLGRPGEYFRFDHQVLDAAFGRDAWAGRRFAVVLPRSGAFDQVRLWHRSGETEFGFGRSDTTSEGHRWRVGDILMVLGMHGAPGQP